MIGRLLQRFRSGPDCAEVMEVLQAYLDGEVDAATAAGVARHLDRCGGCRAESETYRRIIEHLRRQSPRVEAEVLTALEQFGRGLLGGEATT